MADEQRLAEVFAQARKAAGLTQEGVARRLNVDRTSISRIENGHTGLPSVHVLEQCEGAFGLTPGTLVSLLPDPQTAVVDPPKTWPSFPYDRVVSLLNAATRRVWILQTWVDLHAVHHEVGTAVGNGAELRVLVLEPDCPAMRVRMADLDMDDPRYPFVHGYKLLAELQRIPDIGDLDLVARTVSRYPPIQLWLIDDVVIIGYFWATGWSGVGPHMEMSALEPLSVAAVEQFETLWAESVPARFPLE